ncbi:MAG: FAD-dependent oxidoreductase [Rhizobiaceae bacterium]
MAGYEYKPFEYDRPPGLTGSEPRHQVIIVGAGPIGLAMAIDFALRGVKTVVLDDNNVVSVGSRAICWSKRTLEIFDRLGVGERMLEKGVTWKVGRLFHRDREVYNFDLLPEEGHKYPAFINLQQYYVEQYLVERTRDFPGLIDIRFKNKVVNHIDHGEHVEITIETPDGNYNLECDYLIACDGAGSSTRARMNLPFEGHTFEEHFLIVDVEMEESPFETEVAERWFWFEPPFHPGQSALLHKQPDNLYRIDLQLGPETDPQEEATKEKVLPRIRAIIGEKPFKLDWMSVYKFRCAKLERFLHNRVIFVGDSAHVVSPFGARGGNGGIQDVDNLGWKLAEVLDGGSSTRLLQTYSEERCHGSAENILNSTRATNFMTPKSEIEHRFRNEVLNLAADHTFARKLINSGRLSVPCSLEKFDLQTPGPGKLTSGNAVIDVPLKDGRWLIEILQGEFMLVGFGHIEVPEIEGLKRIGVGQKNDDYLCVEPLGSTVFDRYGEESLYLMRPDGHVAASFDKPDPASIRDAYKRAMAAYKDTG